MIKPLFLVAFLLLFSAKLCAQDSFSVRGVVIDTTSELSLENAVVNVLHAKDSILVNFTRATKDGSFHMTGLKDGDYIVMVSYPKYTDYVEKFSIDSGSNSHDFGTVSMLLVSQLLKDVVITGRNTITIKGDTIEYDASKFTIQPNSKVEDLLAQLPGIQVDKDGKITAQGETVNKVLVDGEEFFGDDPTLVTKNIRGDMVDKVQLYDKKSDQATFTGVDDGVKTKTINIQLKEDSKNGMFGKADAGLATDDLYQAQLMYNTFKGSGKFAAYGTIGNTGKIGLNWRDTDRYASSENIVMDGDMIMITNSSSDELDSFNGQYNGQGIPLAHSGGLHYDTKWNEKKESINANYKIGSIEVDGIENTITQNNLPEGVQYSNTDENENNFMFRQKIDARYEFKADSNTSLTVVIDGTLKNSRTTQSTISDTRNEAGESLNQSSGSNRNEGDSRDFHANILWNKRLKKKGRTLSVSLDQRISDSDRKGFLNSESEFFRPGKPDSTHVIDQRKENDVTSSVFSSNINITEPLSEFLTWSLNYRFNLNKGRSNLLSYNRSAGGAYDQLDSLYSNEFDLDQLTHAVGTSLNYKKDKHTVNVGLSGADVTFKQNDLFLDDFVKRSFVNLNTNARWQYNFSQQKSMRFSYNGRTSQPSLAQIQPVRENSDALNQTIGNPELDPSFRHSFNAGYNTYKMLSGQYFNIYIYGSVTSKAIVGNVTTDSVGKSTYRYENLRDNMPLDLSAYFYYGSKLKSLNLEYGASGDIGQNTYYNMINGELNETTSGNYSLQLNLSKNVAKKFSAGLSFGPQYTSSVSSLQKQSSNEGWGFDGDASFTVYLPKKFEVFSDATYTFKEATEAFDEDFERLIWNGGVRKKFLKTDELILSVYANDILDQNVGFNRQAYNNRITQKNYTTIKRYFMFSLTWEFNKMGGSR